MVTEWATQQKERRPCSAALAMAYMEVLETAARHLPVDDAPHHQALFIQGVSQCDTLWKAAVAMIQDPSNPLEQRIDAQEVVTAANLCISAVLRPVSLPTGMDSVLQKGERWTCTNNMQVRCRVRVTAGSASEPQIDQCIFPSD